MLQTCFGNVSDMLWPCFTHDLDIFWQCFRHVFGNVSDMFWLSKCFAAPPPCLRLLDVVLESIFDSSWKIVFLNFGFFWRPQGGSNRAKIASRAVWGGYVLLNMASGSFLTRLGSPYHPILIALGGSKEAPRRPKLINNRFWLLLKIRKVKIMIFDTPPLQNHCFWGPMKAKMEAKSDLETIFWVLDVDNHIPRHIQQASEAPEGGVHAFAPPEKHRGARLDKTPRIGFRSIGVHKSEGWVSRAPYIIY